MCGLVGIALSHSTKFTKMHSQAFRALLLMNQMRGRHSTGIVVVPKTLDNCINVKALGGPGPLLATNEWQEIEETYLRPGNVAAIFGHGRSATVGKVITENAHPFVYRDGSRCMAFVHNGTLIAYQSLPGMDKYDVDSDWLGKQIFDLGPKDAIEQIDGAMACIWFDTKDKMLHLYRNRERPLNFMQRENSEFFIASEDLMLDVVNHLYDIGLPEKDINSLKDDSLSSICLKDEDLSFINETIRYKHTFSSSSYTSSSFWDKAPPPPVYAVDRSGIVSKESTVARFKRFSDMSIKNLSLKFKSEDVIPGAKIKHKGVINNKGIVTFPFLNEYKNSVGECHNVGDLITMEVFSADVINGVMGQTGFPLLRITGFPIGAPRQSFSKFEFVSSLWTEQEVITAGGIKGKIAALRCITDDEAKETGDPLSVVSGRLEEVKLVTI